MTGTSFIYQRHTRESGWRRQETACSAALIEAVISPETRSIFGS